jgi:hypothetical protein
MIGWWSSTASCLLRPATPSRRLWSRSAARSMPPTPALGPTHRRRPHRAGPPATRSRPAPGHRWGAAPAERDRRPQPPRPPRRPGQPGQPRPPGGRGGSAGQAQGGDGPAGWGDGRGRPLEPQACRRLACDATITRVIVSRHPEGCTHGPGSDPNDPAGSDLEGLLRAVLAKLPRPWAAPPPGPWMWAAPPGWSARPNAAPWPSATAAVSSPAVRGRWPDAKPIMSGIGWMAAPPTWTTWPWSAGPITGASMRAAGGWPADPTGASPPPHPIEELGPPNPPGRAERAPRL